MKTTLHTLPRRLTAFALAVLLAVPTAFAAAGEQKLQTSVDILDGLTYRNTITVNKDSRVESFSLELEEDSDVYPIFLQGSGAVYGAASINKAVTNAQAAGYHVVGAMNTDFFSMSSGIPMGIVIEDGVYKSCGGDENAMVITDEQVSIMGHPQVSMTLTNHTNGNVVTPRYFNKLRTSTGGLYLCNSDFSATTRSSGNGWFVRMKLVSSEPVLPAIGLAPTEEELSSQELTVNSTLELVVTELVQGEGALDIGEDEYVLTAADASGYNFVYSSFQVGDRITLQTSCQDAVLSQAQWAGGVGDILIQNGAITDSSNWTYKSDGRQPRSAIGMKADGTLVVYAVDGRQSGYSIGLSEMDLADELLKQGCIWAVNVDGGGSTAMSVWLPGQSGSSLQSVPSGGSPRSCATYLLLVTDEKGDGEADRLAFTQDGQTVLAGTSLTLPSVAALDNGLNPVKADLEELTFTSLEDLGVIEDGVYTAGNRAGTDTILITSEDEQLEGTAQIHVVSSLTSFTVSKKGSTQALTSLTVDPGEQVQLTASGSYWGRTALRGWESVTCTVNGGVGTVDENGLFTASSTLTSGSITVSAGGKSQTITVSPSYVHNDVTPDHWAYTAVEYCYAHNIVSGISPTEFGRDNQIRRGDFMLMLYNALGKPASSHKANFTDVLESDYYYTALSWAQGAGLATGTGDGAYSPTAPVTREQAFTILRQALPLLGKNCPDGDLSVLDQFSDRDQIADYAKGHTATLVSQGLVSGKGDGIDPKGNLTRAEMAAILYKAITFTPNADPSVDPSQYTLTMDVTQMILSSGDSTTLTASLSPAYENAVFTWTSSDPSVAVVSDTGKVTNIYTGSSDQIITITASWQGLSASCSVVCTSPQRTGVVTGTESRLNVRSGPDTTYSVIGSLEDGDTVVVLGEENGWYHILYADQNAQAVTGYVSGSYLVVTP